MDSVANHYKNDYSRLYINSGAAMTTRITLAFLTFCLLTAGCGSDGGKQSFHPSEHKAGIQIEDIAPSNLRDGYRHFDRAAVLARIESDDRYAPLVEKAKKQVEKLVAMSDDEIRALIPPANTIRALMVNTHGCPIHGGGTSVYQPFGISVDLDYPLAVKCPIGGEVFPNDDFPDDGSGWVDNRPGSPTEGEKYYFVGWFNHWFLRMTPTWLETMARLEFITGDTKYGDKAVVLLERFMDVYPDIDGKDLTYDGSDWGVYVKMLPTMWEGGALLNLIDAVELLLPRLDDDFLGRFHEAVFRPAYEAYKKQPAPSNWGNGWNAPFARFAKITGEKEYLDYMLYEHPVAVVPTLDNQYFRDGFPYEAGFGYCTHYMYDDQHIAEALGEHGGWIWEHPNLKQSFEGFADMIILDKYTHFFGDAGGLKNTGLTLRTSILEEAFLRYKSPIIARNLLQAYDLYGTARVVSLDDLFTDYEPPAMDEVKTAAAKAPALKSTLAPVKGFAVMRTGEGGDRAALWFDYGYAHAAHSHADRLNINLFALGREFLPEMGYPEYMDSIQPTPGGWTTHTVSHITVEVNEKRQLEGVFGDLHAFVHADGVKYVDASCEDAYVHADVDLYRRSLALINIPGGAYAVDIFRVRGGKQHDYLFHGPPVDMELDNVTLSKPRKGTLAGENVEFGLKPDNVLPYHVDNKGYQYLFDVCEGNFDGPYRASWKMEDGVTLSADFLPDKDESFIKTTGYPRPSQKNLPPMPFLVRRIIPENSSDLSVFASVLSYTKDSPIVNAAERIKLSSDSDSDACIVRVSHKYGEDIILSCLTPSGFVKSADNRFELHGQFAVCSIREGAPTKLFLAGGTSFSVDGETITLPTAEATATVLEVSDNSLVLDQSLPVWAEGEIMRAKRGEVQSSYKIESIAGNTVNVTPGTWIGKGRADRIDTSAETIYDSRDIFPLGEKRNRLADISGMEYPGGNRNYYAGAWLVSEDGADACRLKSGGFPGFVLDSGVDMEDVAKAFPPKTPFLLYDLGPGDTVRVLRWGVK